MSLAHATKISRGRLGTGMFNLMKRYEDIIGITEVKLAQRSVIEAEEKFASCQEQRRLKQDQIQNVQFQLKEIHSEFDKTTRGEDRYLHLLTQEHTILKQERTLLAEFKLLDQEERDHFQRLSQYLRNSHEKERERGEKTKYWSIIGSAVGALIGIIGTTVNNRLRMRELRSLVEQSSDPLKVQHVIGSLAESIQSQQTQIRGFVNEIRCILEQKPRILEVDAASDVPLIDAAKVLAETDAVLRQVRDHDVKLDLELTELKRMIAIDRGYHMENDGSIVYVGPEIKSMLDDTEKKLEWKMKISTLVNVVMVYGALAVTLPILYAIFNAGGGN